MNKPNNIYKKTDQTLSKFVFLFINLVVKTSMTLGKFITGFDYRRIYAIGIAVEISRVLLKETKNKNYKKKKHFKKKNKQSIN